MRTPLVLLLLASLAACRTSRLGHCASDLDCPAAATCDLARAVCVAPAAQCFPVCDGAHACDAASLQCVAATSAEVALTTPAADTIVSGDLQATATAHAPGGVTAVSFELRDAQGQLLIAASGAPVPRDARAWGVTLSLNGVGSGPATLTALASYGSQTAASAPVALNVHAHACFPSCPGGQACESGACVASTCAPACDAAHVCRSGSCVAAGSASVILTSPAAFAFASGTLQTTATASAPGGITFVRFDLSVGGTVVATAMGTPSAASPSNFSASVPLAGVADGPATLRATATYPAGTVTSPPLAIGIDQTAPVISLVTDGTAKWYGAGQTASIVASIGDGAGSGVVDASVALTVAGHAAINGIRTAPGTYTFSVPVGDAMAPAGVDTTVPFQISARDAAANVATRPADAKSVIKVDRTPPQIANIGYATAEAG